MFKIGKNKTIVFDRILVLSFIFMAAVSNCGLKPTLASAGLGDKKVAVIFLENVIKVSTPATEGYDRHSRLYRPWADARQVSKVGSYYDPKSRFYSAFWDPISPCYNKESEYYSAILDKTSYLHQ